jgi:hypothetical protein
VQNLFPNVSTFTEGDDNSFSYVIATENVRDVIAGVSTMIFCLGKI